MHESSSITTTQNGFEIEHSREALSFQELQQMAGDYGIVGESPQQRTEALRGCSTEVIAMFLTDLNRRLQGSDDTLTHEEVMKVGGVPTISPEDRFDIFAHTIEGIKSAPKDINPGRIGDTLALATVLLHPFKDGNGRTSRVIGFMFKDYYDQPDAAEAFDQVVTSREAARQKGEKTITVTYVPQMDEGDRSDPAKVKEYIDSLLTQEDVRYMGLGGEYSELRVA